ncbi:unnamed protein product [Pylaiella littoralis]
MTAFGGENGASPGAPPASAAAAARENCPLQLVSTGNAEDDYSFALCEDNLDRVLSKVPEGMEVSVVSVVGAFRTGKSFLLSFFLRYLNSGSEDDTSEDWMTADGPSLREGNRNPQPATSGGQQKGEEGEGEGEGETLRSFEWRGGVERMTTGIWMWSEPFVKRTEGGKEIAVLVVDTQGMFDNETSMGLTACIFAVSTLLSSCQIYNVEKRIQEDHLQQLALFSEYGRMALNKEQSIAAGEKDDETGAAADGSSGDTTAAVDADVVAAAAHGELPSLKGTATAVGFAAKAAANAEARRAAAAAGGAGGEAAGAGSAAAAAGDVPAVSQDWVERPFQRLEFLVRDWQNYEDEDLPGEKLQDEMNEYLASVIEDKGVKDLRDTREQITSCFEKISCFGLTHPGFDVVKKTFSGDIAKIQPSFLRLLNTYVRHIFGELLEPKRINGRFLTAPELRNYASAYVALFHNGAHFPAARSLLEATAGAHNGNAKHVAVQKYKAEMDQLLGPNATGYLSPVAFEEHERLCREGGLGVFTAMATMGRRSEVLRVRALLMDELEDAKLRYAEVNSGRNPFRGTEYWIIPMIIAFASYVARWIADLSCSAWSHSCRKTSDTLGFIYFAMVVVLLIMFRQKIKGVAEHFGNLLPVVLGNVKEQMQQAAANKGK